MRVWELDPVARKVRPTEISFGKNSRDINCIAVEPGDEHIYFGTASGDVSRRALAAPLLRARTHPWRPPLEPSPPPPNPSHLPAPLAARCRTPLPAPRHAPARARARHPLAAPRAGAHRGEAIRRAGAAHKVQPRHFHDLRAPVGGAPRRLGRRRSRCARPWQPRAEVEAEGARRSLVSGHVCTGSRRALARQPQRPADGRDSRVPAGRRDAMGDFLFLGTTEANMYLVKYEGLIAELKTTCHTGMINDLTFPHGSAETFATCSGSDIRVWHARTLSELLRIQVPNLEAMRSPSSSRARRSSPAGTTGKSAPFSRSRGA